LGLYTYTHSNPTNFIDPNGKETAVSIGRPTKNNPFGHTAIAFTGKGVYSYGTGREPGSSFSKYLGKQAAYRNTKVYILDTTPKQEAKMLAEIKRYKNIDLPNPKKDPISALGDTCASRTQKSLEAGDVDSVFVPFKSPLPGDTEIIAIQNSDKSINVKQGDSVPKVFEKFNKKEGN